MFTSGEMTIDFYVMIDHVTKIVAMKSGAVIFENKFYQNFSE